jgi:hypothetical protein
VDGSWRDAQTALAALRVIAASAERRRSATGVREGGDSRSLKFSFSSRGSLRGAKSEQVLIGGHHCGRWAHDNFFAKIRNLQL